ncbi:MAG: hypothetical protein ACXAD7_00070 [Candidatus Kariarchaeaceae archaeon]|jgi:hypothetical protein
MNNPKIILNGITFGQDMTKNEECMIAILKSESDSLTTKQILSKTSLFPELCIGCSSGSHVITAGISLCEKGLVNRKLGKGGYKWTLN